MDKLERLERLIEILKSPFFDRTSSSFFKDLLEVTVELIEMMIFHLDGSYGVITLHPSWQDDLAWDYDDTDELGNPKNYPIYQKVVLSKQEQKLLRKYLWKVHQWFLDFSIKGIRKPPVMGGIYDVPIDDLEEIRQEKLDVQDMYEVLTKLKRRNYKLLEKLIQAIFAAKPTGRKPSKSSYFYWKRRRSSRKRQNPHRNQRR
jgi:hypothetical protein